MAGHEAPPAKQIPARRSAAVRCLAVAAAALGMMSPALGFSPCVSAGPRCRHGGRVFSVADTIRPAAPAPCAGKRLSAPLSLRMAAAPDNGLSKFWWDVQAAFQKFHKKVWRDALDQSWRSQTLVRTPSAEAREAAEAQAKALQQCTTYAAEMRMMQQLMSKKTLMSYQLLNQLEQPSSFESLYSDICLEGDASLPFCDALETLANAASEAESQAHLSPFPKGSSGVRFLQDHLRGVPDLQASGEFSAPDVEPDADPKSLVGVDEPLKAP